MKLNIVVYTIHVICQDIDGGATEGDGGASAPVGPSVATPLLTWDTNGKKVKKGVCIPVHCKCK